MQTRHRRTPFFFPTKVFHCLCLSRHPASYSRFLPVSSPLPSLPALRGIARGPLPVQSRYASSTVNTASFREYRPFPLVPLSATLYICSAFHPSSHDNGKIPPAASPPHIWNTSYSSPLSPPSPCSPIPHKDQLNDTHTAKVSSRTTHTPDPTLALNPMSLITRTTGLLPPLYLQLGNPVQRPSRPLPSALVSPAIEKIPAFLPHHHLHQLQNLLKCRLAFFHRFFPFSFLISTLYPHKLQFCSPDLVSNLTVIKFLPINPL